MLNRMGYYGDEEMPYEEALPEQVRSRAEKIRSELGSPTIMLLLDIAKKDAHSALVQLASTPPEDTNRIWRLQEVVRRYEWLVKIITSALEQGGLVSLDAERAQLEDEDYGFDG